MLASGFAKGLLNSIGLPILLMIAVGGMFGWRLIKDASKSMVAVGLLALVGGFALWHWWPSNGGTVTWCPPHQPDPPPMTHTPSVQPLPKYRKVEEGEPPLSWAEIHKPSIDDLHAKRMKKVGGTPEKLAEWLDPARR